MHKTQCSLTQAPHRTTLLHSTSNTKEHTHTKTQTKHNEPTKETGEAPSLT